MDKEVIVRVAGAEVECSVMRTEEELALGLQGHNDLKAGEGMLFLFPQPKTPTFWMGKVAFPIDIVGIDENSRITKIVEDAQPGTTSRWTFHRVSAVLEVPGRWCLKNGINVGDRVDALDFPTITKKRRIAVDFGDPNLVMGSSELTAKQGFNANWPQWLGMIYGTYVPKGAVFTYEGGHQAGMADAIHLREYASDTPGAMKTLPYLERMPGTRHRLRKTDGKMLWVTDEELGYFDVTKAPDLKGARQRRLEREEMPGETVSQRPPSDKEGPVELGPDDIELIGGYDGAFRHTAGSDSYKGINFTPPKGARDAAQAGLNLRKEYGRGGTAVGIARARDIARGAKLSPETMKRMKAFFDRHQKNRGSGSESPPKNGWIAWQLWGGDAGRSWANKVVKQMEARKKK
jgi:uncharacterized membrane protein (UPF0127 family)